MAKKDDGQEYGLQPRSMKARRRWAADCDYFDKLPPDARAWMERFGREYYGGDSKALEAPDALHATRELKRACYQLDNFARVDVWSRGQVLHVETLEPRSSGWVDEGEKLTWKSRQMLDGAAGRYVRMAVQARGVEEWRSAK